MRNGSTGAAVRIAVLYRLMRQILLVSVALTMSCGSDDGGAQSADAIVEQPDIASSDSSAADTTTSSDVLADGEEVLLADAAMYGPFPGGPYGNKVGDVLPNLSWRGFVNETSDAFSNTKPFVNTTLDALRRTARRPYALIHVSEFF
jgi:hypothetical protein